MNYLNLIRWPNVLMTVLTQLLVIYVILEPSGLELALEAWQVGLLVIATALLTAGGNVINDIYDVNIDAVNKPEKVIVGKYIAEERAFTLYMVLTSIAVVCGFVLANSVDRPILAVVFVIVAFVLYSYATTLKSMLLVGNIVISLLVGLVILIPGVFELVPVATPQTREAQVFLMSLLLDFTVLAFVINLAREWVKDCEDINGDHAGGRNTLPIALGRTRAARFVSVFIMGIIVAVAWYVDTYLFKNQLASYYFILAIIGPLLFVMIKLWNAATTKHYRVLSRILKMILLLGILSIIVIRIKY
ncbi:MAG: geranylgeranylglycerol-phosphate geranylgeranyltransferase [Nonlabens sp.]|nr:geranylgeranylglycerol-phosphate geranylgeranyltransferase [Nonlabens sp.]